MAGLDMPSVGCSLGFPSEQLLLLLLDPFCMVVGHLHVHDRLVTKFIIVAVLGIPDDFGS